MTFLFLSSEMLLVRLRNQPLHFSQTTNNMTTLLQARNLSSQYVAKPKASSTSREQTCSCLGLISHLQQPLPILSCLGLPSFKAASRTEVLALDRT